MDTLNIFESSFHTHCEKLEALRIKLAPFFSFFDRTGKKLYAIKVFFGVCVKLSRLCKVAPNDGTTN
jgi:hypothetical protein